MTTYSKTRRWAAALWVALACGAVHAFDPEYYEESAGISIGAQMDVKGNVYGFSAESGTWLTGTPVFGQMFLTMLNNKTNETWYGGVGMIFRVMPHTDLAPFVGAGAGYYHPLNDSADGGDDPNAPEAYWGGHAEAGVRWWFGERTRFLELLGRETFRDEESGGNYTIVGIGYGQNF